MSQRLGEAVLGQAGYNPDSLFAQVENRVRIIRKEEDMSCGYMCM